MKWLLIMNNYMKNSVQRNFIILWENSGEKKGCKKVKYEKEMTISSRKIVTEMNNTLLK